MGGAGDLKGFRIWLLLVSLQPALAYVNWPKTLVLGEGRYSITPRNTTSTRPRVGGNTEVCLRGNTTAQGR